MREAAALESLAQLKPGDYLVHGEHGIGVYRGLVQLDVGPRGATRERVPAHRVRRRRPALRAGAPPLAGAALRRRRRRAAAHSTSSAASPGRRPRRNVKTSLRDMARELLSAPRRARARRRASRSRRAIARSRSSRRASRTRRRPTSSPRSRTCSPTCSAREPMDRLVCGDVGFGKTEVAVRAAFKAVMDGKQVAVLVPTTVLCAQHEETFRKRFDGYPVRDRVALALPLAEGAEGRRSRARRRQGRHRRSARTGCCRRTSSSATSACSSSTRSSASASRTRSASRSSRRRSTC